MAERGKLTYANVVSTLALFLGLGGVSYATIVLPANSVGTRQLRAGAVTARVLGVPLEARSVTDERAVDLPKSGCNAPLRQGEVAPPCVPTPFGEGEFNRALRLMMRSGGELYASGVVGFHNDGAPDTAATIRVEILLGERRIGHSSLHLVGGQTAYVPLQSTTATSAGAHTLKVTAEAVYDSRDPGDVVAFSSSLAVIELPPTSR